jgi:hypothetical protein
MIALDDSMMQQVQAAARALPPRVRENYLQTLSRLLEGQRPLSLGSVQKACGQAQQHCLQSHALAPDDNLSFLG